ncbi:MAG: hypothetical protein K2X74_11410 [Acetobacteraceae bacterium]|nr:hypothetical protein [Acetobacteraceae bacterium]
MTNQSNLEIQTKFFFEEFKREVIAQCQIVNANHDGYLQDGFQIQDMEDGSGWITCKGMSWGFALQDDPACIIMTFGPDWPFVGYKHILSPQLLADKVIFINKANDNTFVSAEQLARHGLECLAKKLHDCLPNIEQKIA